jgi:hypothetical protein
MPDMQNELKQELSTRAVPDALIEEIADSGYWLRHWASFGPGRSSTSVSDMMYGNKQQSSNFEIENFIEYAKGNYRFPELPPFRRYKAKSLEDIDHVLQEHPRPRYIGQGLLSFRGQPREHKFKRKIPNPLRADVTGAEISVMAGAFRQKTPLYSFKFLWSKSGPFRGSCRI